MVVRPGRHYVGMEIFWMQFPFMDSQQTYDWQLAFSLASSDCLLSPVAGVGKSVLWYENPSIFIS